MPDGVTFPSNAHCILQAVFPNSCKDTFKNLEGAMKDLTPPYPASSSYDVDKTKFKNGSRVSATKTYHSTLNETNGI